MLYSQKYKGMSRCRELKCFSVLFKVCVVFKENFETGKQRKTHMTTDHYVKIRKLRKRTWIAATVTKPLQSV